MFSDYHIDYRASLRRNSRSSKSRKTAITGRSPLVKPENNVIIKFKADKHTPPRRAAKIPLRRGKEKADEDNRHENDLGSDKK